MTLAIHVRGLDGLAITPPTTPEFDAVARPLIGRVADLGLQLKPLLVVVTNESAKTVVSFSKTWRVTYPDGKIMTVRGHTSFAHVVCGDVLVSNEPPGMPPGAQRVEAMSVVIQGWGDYPDGEYYDQFLPQFVTEKDRMLRNATDLHVELNAAIFSDGTLVGPDDESWLSELFSSYVRAKQDWYRTIITALDAGASVSEAFGPLDRFMEEARRRMRAHRFDPERPNAIWAQEAAADAMRWRRRYEDDAIPRLLKEAIRLEPFLLRRPSAGATSSAESA
jgi:hypothetical protein